jgi:hypothetical protein
MRTTVVVFWCIAALGLALACGGSSSGNGNPGSAGEGGTGGTGGFGGTGEGGTGGTEGEHLPSADHERLAETLRALADPAMGGRRTGLASGDRAEAFIRKYLEDHGLEVRDQEVSLPVPELAPPTALEILGENGEVVDSFAYLTDYREVRWSGEGNVEGDLVFVGHGVMEGAIDAYLGLDVVGKIVAVVAGNPTPEGADPRSAARLDKKIAVAAAKGAVGVVFVLTGNYAKASRQQGVEAEVLAGDGGYGFDPEVRVADVPAVFVHADATARLLGLETNELVAAEPREVGKRVRLELHATAARSTCRNLFAVLPGTGPDAEEVVVMGAHYDHIGRGADGVVFPGASDNATGTAVVLEAAATLAAAPEKPNRTVVFALFCGEELGLYGSEAYVADPLFPLEQTRLMVQFDYFGNRGPIYVSNVDGGRLIARFIRDEDRHPEYPLHRVDWQGQCASDDCGFLREGVRAYRFLSEGDHHHRTTDSFENLSLPIVERVADIAVAGLKRAAW